MFRKNGIIAALITAMIVIVFDVFFLDAVVKSSIIKAGSKMAGAKVEIGYLHVDMLKSKITVKNIAVADKAREFKNVFSADEAVADYMFLPLLENKYIVENISVVNLSAGSDRKTSGFLKAAELKKLEKEQTADKTGSAGKMQASLSAKAPDEKAKMPVSKITDIKDIKNIDLKQLFKKEDLASYKAVLKAQAGIKEEKEKTQAAIKSADIDNKVKQTKESIKKIREIKVTGVSDIPAAKEALIELDKVKANSDTVIKAAQKAKTDGEAFYAYSKTVYREINAAKEKDYQAVLAKADIKMLNADSIEKALIGDLWFDRIQSITRYMALAEKYIPKKKKTEKNPVFVKKRGSGREIVYSSGGRYPGFWIKKAVLSVKGSDKGSAYYMKGEIQDITSQQYITGKPLRISLQLDNPSQLIDINAAINHIDDVNDKLEITLKNLPASFIGLDKADFGNVKIDKAKVGVIITAQNKPEVFSINGSINITDMAVSSADKQDIAYLAIKGIKDLKIMFAAKQADAFSMEVSSNAFDRVKSSLKGIYGSKIEKAKQDAKKAVDDAIKGELKGLTGNISESEGSVGSDIKDINAKTAQIQPEIDKAKAELNKKISEAGGKQLLKGLFK